MMPTATTATNVNARSRSLVISEPFGLVALPATGRRAGIPNKMLGAISEKPLSRMRRARSVVETRKSGTAAQNKRLDEGRVTFGDVRPNHFVEGTIDVGTTGNISVRRHFKANWGPRTNGCG